MGDSALIMGLTGLVVVTAVAIGVVVWSTHRKDSKSGLTPVDETTTSDTTNSSTASQKIQDTTSLGAPIDIRLPQQERKIVNGVVEYIWFTGVSNITDQDRDYNPSDPDVFFVFPKAGQPATAPVYCHSKQAEPWKRLYSMGNTENGFTNCGILFYVYPMYFPNTIPVYLHESTEHADLYILNPVKDLLPKFRLRIPTPLFYSPKPNRRRKAVAVQL